MKKVIKAELYIPHIDFEVVKKKYDEFDKLVQTCLNCNYQIYEGTLYDKDIIGFDCEIISNTQKECNADYILFKRFINQVYCSVPKEHLKMKLDRVC